MEYFKWRYENIKKFRSFQKEKKSVERGNCLETAVVNKARCIWNEPQERFYF